MEEKDVYKLYDKYLTPEHIRRHCSVVSEIAVKIGEKYERKGIKIDIESLKLAGLLHDVVRIIDLNEENYKELCKDKDDKTVEVWNKLREKYKNMSHSDAAYEILSEKGEYKIARLVKIHRFDAVLDKIDKPETIEEKILTYADKRVLHEDVVSLKNRFEDGRKRYNPQGKKLDEEKRIHDEYFKLEKELFEGINLRPSEITN